MTGNRKELPAHEMSMTEGVRPKRGKIRARAEKSLADSSVGTPPVCGEPGYRRTYGEATKLASEASSIAYQPRCETARGEVPDAERLTEPLCSHRHDDAATTPSSRPVAR